MALKDPEKEKERQVLRHKQQKEFLAELKNKPCEDCGNSFSAVCMDFHHLNNDGNGFDFAKVSKKRVLEEVEKCVLLCSNCHRLRHYK